MIKNVFSGKLEFATLFQQLFEARIDDSDLNLIKSYVETGKISTFKASKGTFSLESVTHARFKQQITNINCND